MHLSTLIVDSTTYCGRTLNWVDANKDWLKFLLLLLISYLAIHLLLEKCRQCTYIFIEFVMDPSLKHEPSLLFGPQLSLLLSVCAILAETAAVYLYELILLFLKQSIIHLYELILFVRPSLLLFIFIGILRSVNFVVLETWTLDLSLGYLAFLFWWLSKMCSLGFCWGVPWFFVVLWGGLNTSIGHLYDLYLSWFFL